jgi:hypothetical protein
MVGAKRSSRDETVGPNRIRRDVYCVNAKMPATRSNYKLVVIRFVLVCVRERLRTSICLLIKPGRN